MSRRYVPWSFKSTFKVYEKVRVQNTPTVVRVRDKTQNVYAQQLHFLSNSVKKQ